MYDLVCFSHLRWQFVFQRPQHLLTRFGRQRRVIYIEEPVWTSEPSHMESHDGGVGVVVLTAALQHGLAADEAERVQTAMIEAALAEHGVRDYVLWFYTPMAVALAHDLEPLAVVYDCMDELSAFKDASPELMARERQLLTWADVVFTGGHSLYEAKRDQHANVHAFPSSVDVPHFAAARGLQSEPRDMSDVPRPRFGFCGVIDERLDIELLEGVAAARPDWHFVMIGPVVKIDESSLPRRPNLHYLGPKDYSELPRYVSGWDVAIMPFALNAATRFISPTKTPEYLAAGKPVVSTPIADVVRTYGDRGLCRIADSVQSFVNACEAALEERDSAERLKKVDAFLAQGSWDATWQKMADVLDLAVRTRPKRSGTFLMRGVEGEARPAVASMRDTRAEEGSK